MAGAEEVDTRYIFVGEEETAKKANGFA